MTDPFALYTCAWLAATAMACILMIRHRKALELFRAAYWRFLLQPWKAASFAVAGASLTLLAPYANDYTWDRIDALVMSVLAFATAPWAVGALYRAFRRRAPWTHGYIASCLWLFSASWFYDAYIWLRDGEYSPYWLTNLVLSSILYLSAGLLWNLEWTERTGVVFQFTEPDWPKRGASRPFAKIVWAALPFAIIAIAVIAPFLV